MNCVTRRGFAAVAGAICLGVLGAAGCSSKPQTDQQIQQQAAQTTKQVKESAKQAAQDAKAAAANAEREVNDIAAGVKEGLGRSANANAVDINSASEASLRSLPGITATRAGRIINNRPYAAPHDLVTKGVLTRSEYLRISGRIVTR